MTRHGFKRLLRVSHYKSPQVTTIKHCTTQAVSSVSSTGAFEIRNWLLRCFWQFKMLFLREETAVRYISWPLHKVRAEAWVGMMNAALHPGPAESIKLIASGAEKVQSYSTMSFTGVRSL